MVMPAARKLFQRMELSRILDNPSRFPRLLYSAVIGESGETVSSVRGISKGDIVRIRFSDGEATATVESISERKELTL